MEFNCSPPKLGEFHTSPAKLGEFERDPQQVHDVVVVGAGWAGIAAAVACVERGAHVVVLEQGHTLGGKVSDVEAAGVQIAGGPSAFEARRQNILALIDKLGLSDHVVRVAPKNSARYVVIDGRLVALKPGWGMLGNFTALPMRARADVLREPWAAAPAVQDESVAAFFRRRFGRTVTERLVLALTNGIWAGDADTLSMRACFPDLVAHERHDGSVLKGVWRRARRGHAIPSGTLTLRGGLGVLAARAGERLHVRTGTAVKHLEELPDGTVRVVTSAGIVRAKTVIVATEAPAAARMLRPIAPAAAELLDGIVYAPLSVVHWRERTTGSSKLPRGFGYLAAPAHARFSLGTLFASDLLNSDVDAHAPRRFASYVGGLLHPERAALSNEALLAGVKDEIATLCGGDVEELLSVQRHSHAVAQPTIGHDARHAALDRALAATRIVLAGSYRGAGAMKDAVHSGFVAAHQALSLARAVVVTLAPPAKSNAHTPLVVVGASYKDANTDARAALVAIEQQPDAPSQALVRGGWADAVVVVETCSRVEWVISSPRADFAADLLSGTLAASLPGVRLHRRDGGAAVHYLMRVTLGLDSVAEGELAVGRQVARAFEHAHARGLTDLPTKTLWRSLQQLLAERRKRGVVQHSVGVQLLAVDAAAQRGVVGGTALVLGSGEIGVATATLLRTRGFVVHTHGRTTRDAFDEAARTADAVFVCSGAPTRYLDLPMRTGAVVVDVGSPQQVRHAPGWQLVTLEELLSHPRAQLNDAQRDMLADLVKVAADRVVQELHRPPPKHALSAIDEERKVFLRETLPPLLAQLDGDDAAAVHRACTAFAHTLMARVREDKASSEPKRVAGVADA